MSSRNFLLTTLTKLAWHRGICLQIKICDFKQSLSGRNRKGRRQNFGKYIMQLFWLTPSGAPAKRAGIKSIKAYEMIQRQVQEPFTILLHWSLHPLLLGIEERLRPSYCSRKSWRVNFKYKTSNIDQTLRIQGVTKRWMKLSLTRDIGKVIHIIVRTNGSRLNARFLLLVLIY